MFWIIGILLIIIIVMFLTIKDKQEQSDTMSELRDSDQRKFSNEINEITRAISTGHREFDKYNTTCSLEIKELKLQISKAFQESNDKIKESNDKFKTLQEKYYKLLRTYMIARKINEVEAIDEIETSIIIDYEALGINGSSSAEYIASAMADFYTLSIKDSENELTWMRQIHRSQKIAEVRETAVQLISRAKKQQYLYEYALAELLDQVKNIKESHNITIDTKLIENYTSAPLSYLMLKEKCDQLEESINRCHEDIQLKVQKISQLKSYCLKLEEQNNSKLLLLKNSIDEYKKEFSSNMSAIPYMSRIFADITTMDLDKLSFLSLFLEDDIKQNNKVSNLHFLAKSKHEEIERYKNAEYQLAYLLELYPNLQEVIDTEFNDLNVSYDDITNYDPIYNFIEKNDWESLSESDRNQLALDRYVESRKKSNWQIGRDYEMYIGYLLEQKGYKVTYTGITKKLEDMGRDLIAEKDNKTLIIQCKNWSHEKVIHEKHIFQLYGTVVMYGLHSMLDIEGVFITTTKLSDTAKLVADYLGIKVVECEPMKDFPRIKCHINKKNGEKIYHLPFDQQYDATVIDDEGEFFAFTVKEAEEKGFRRAFKHYIN